MQVALVAVPAAAVALAADRGVWAVMEATEERMEELEVLEAPEAKAEMSIAGRNRCSLCRGRSRHIRCLDRHRRSCRHH